MTTTRQIGLADARSWERMREALWPASPGEHAREIDAFFRGGVRDPAVAFFAVDADDQPLGFAEASIRPYAEGCESDRVAYLEGLFVDASHRGRGVAAALVRAVEAWGREQNCPELASDAEIRNEASIAMHRALGFDEVERIVCFRKDL